MSSWVVALRVGRREALRAKGRSALVVAMIGLPVLGVTSVAVAQATTSLSADVRASRTLGAADAALADSGAPAIQQDALGHGFNGFGAPTAGAYDPRHGLSRLPVGTTSLVDTTTESEVGAGDRTTSATVRQLAYDAPMAAGIYRQLSGRAPAAGEVVLTRALSRRLNVGPGAVVTLARPAVRLRVVGVVTDSSRTDALAALVDPGTVLGLGGQARVLVDVPGTLRWADVQRLNSVGVVVTPRHRLAGSPPDPPQALARSLTTVVLVVGLALLEVVLLAGPAFAVGAKRQSRELGLLAATGGERRDIRRTVLAGGVVLGAAGGLLGALLGVLAGRFLVPVLVARTHVPAGPFEVPILQVVGIVAVGVGTAVLAAVFPARQAARQDVVAALTGRRGVVAGHRWTPVAGVAAAVVGALIARYGAQHRDLAILLSGSAIAELGLVATTPALVGLAGRLGPLLPATARLALRDASRNRSRTAPAVSAVLAAVAGAVAVGTYLASVDGHSRQQYAVSAATGTVVVPDGGATGTAGVLRAELPGSRVLAVRAVDFERWSVDIAVVPEHSCPLYGLPGPPTRQQAKEAVRDPRCHDQQRSVLGGPVIGGPDVLAALTGVRTAATTAALRAGGVVAPALYVSADGRLRASSGPAPTADQSAPPSPQRVALAAAALPRGVPAYTVLSLAAAARLHVPTRSVGVVAVTDGTPTTAAEDRVRAGLRRAGIQVSPYVERGYPSTTGAGLLALVAASGLLVIGASSIATGLAAAEGRADLATLAAVGASPSLRRGLAGLQSAVTAGLGALLGAVTGLVPAVGLIRAVNSDAGQPAGFVRVDTYPTVIPWGHLALVVLVAPLFAAAAAALLTRSRLPMVRRVG